MNIEGNNYTDIFASISFKRENYEQKQFFSISKTISLKFLCLKSSTEKMTIVVNFSLFFFRVK
jgi:hypothetical protein